MDVNEKLNILGYDKRWLEYGFLTIEELENQFSDYSNALNNPNSKEANNGFQNPEHFRHGLFWKISEDRKSFNNEELRQLIDLVNCDEDQIMAENIYTYLLSKKRINAEQITEFEEFKTVANKT